MKLFKLKKPAKNFYNWVKDLNFSAKIIGLLVILLLITSISATSLKLETGAQTGEVFNKIVWYDSINRQWKKFNINETDEIKAISFDLSVNIRYVTPSAVKKINLSNNAVTNLNYPGNISEVADITEGNKYGAIVMEKNGIWYSYNDDSWINRTSIGQASCPVGSVVKKVGQGVSGEMIVLCNNGDILVGGNGPFANEGKKYNSSLYGNVNSVDIFGNKRVLGTEGGYILSADSSTANYQPAMLDDVSPGNYVFENVQYNDAFGYQFSSAITSNRNTVGFFHYSHTQNILILRAIIPGCEVKKTEAFSGTGPFRSYFLATVKESCDPDAPAPPTPPGEGVTNIYYETNLSYKGVSVHTKVLGPDGVSATVKSGDAATFTLTVNNPETAAKNTDVKFTLPPGFSFVVGSAKKGDGSLYNPTDGTNVANPPGQLLKWTGYNAPSGDSTIIFNAIVP